MDQKEEKTVTKRELIIVITLTLSLVFSTGFLTALVFSAPSSQKEIPLSSTFQGEPSAPHDLVLEEDIQILSDKIIIQLHNASLSRYEPTGSMKPLFDKGANGIRIKPKTPQDIHIGDIVSFKENTDLIVHRVIEKGSDEQGMFFITKGDNNIQPDHKIRFSDIEYITVGVIY